MSDSRIEAPHASAELGPDCHPTRQRHGRPLPWRIRRISMARLGLVGVCMYAVGRCAAPIDPDTSNFSVQYTEWNEDQVLTMDAYSPDGGYGAWIQFEHVDLPPIEAYERGQYLVSGVWRRATGMTFYTKDELCKARSLWKQTAVEASQVVRARVTRRVVFEMHQ